MGGAFEEKLEEQSLHSLMVSGQKCLKGCQKGLALAFFPKNCTENCQLKGNKSEIAIKHDG